MKQLGEVPGADIQDDGDEWKGNDGAFEPDRPHVGVAVHQSHDEEDEGEPEQVNMRDAYQSEDIGASILLGHFLQVIESGEVWNVRVAAVVTTDTALVQQRLDVGFIFR